MGEPRRRRWGLWDCICAVMLLGVTPADYFSASPATLIRVYRQHAPEYQTRAARLMDRRG